MPRKSPDRIGFGDESEVIAGVEEQLAAWRKTPGALAWLEGQQGLHPALHPLHRTTP